MQETNQPVYLDTSASYSVSLEKDLYYTGDEVSGYIHINATKASVIKALHVAIVCRVRWHGGILPDSSHTVWSSTKVVGRGYPVAVGVTKVPFTFGLPDDGVVSTQHEFCTVKWDARLIEHDWTPVAFCRFTMSALYYAQTDIGPRVQQEIGLKKGIPALRAEVSLQKDVYRDGEPINVRFAMHKNGAVVKTIKACVTQNVTYYSGVEGESKKIVQTTMDHSELHHMTSKHHWTKVGSSAGSTCIRNFSCTARRPEEVDDQVALQIRKHNGELLHTTLVPSTTVVECEGTFQSITISYSVDITIHMRGGKKMSLSVPFTLQGDLPEGAASSHDSVDLQNCFTFAIPADEPPVYENYTTASVKSYTCLRPECESLDSLFSQASLLSGSEKKRKSSLKPLHQLRSVIEGHLVPELRYNDVGEEFKVVVNPITKRRYRSQSASYSDKPHTMRSPSSQRSPIRMSSSFNLDE